jgi:uncharacterized protein
LRQRLFLSSRSLVEVMKYGLLAIGLIISATNAQIVDHHQHLFSPIAAEHAGIDPRGITAKDLIGHMDAAGIERAAVLSVAYGLANPNKKQFPDERERVQAENDWTSAQVALYPGRLTGFCSVNPVKDYAVEEIKRCAKDPNLRTGLKLHFGNSDVNLESADHLDRLRQVFRTANQNGMTIVAHIRSTINLNRPYGRTQARIFLEKVIPEAPGVIIQIAHLAGSGGFDDPGHQEALAYFVELVQQKDSRLKNVLFDISGVAGLGKWQDKAEMVAERVRQLGVERVVYGSDAPVPGNLPAEALKRFRTLPLTEQELRRIETNVAPYLKTPTRQSPRQSQQTTRGAKP